MFLLNARCSFSCLLIIALTGLLQIINAESFRPIFNPNIALKSSAKQITAITTTTHRPLTTISATLKSRVSLTKQQAPPRSPVKPLSSPVTAKPTDNAPSDSKDAPVAEALRGDPYYRRGYRRPPYYYPSNNLYYSTRFRRRPNPKPYYSPPSYGYNAPYEDYRFETDFVDQRDYIPKPKKKIPTSDPEKDYAVIDTDIGQFYDSQSATYNVPPIKNYEQQNYYATGAGGTGPGANLGTGSGGGYSDYGDVEEYRYSTTKPKTSYKALPSRPPIKQKTRIKYNNYDENEYRYSGDTSAYGTSAPDIEEITTDPATVAKYNNIYLPQHTIYQTAPKPKPKPKPKPPKTTTSTTTYTPPIKFSDTAIDVLTKPLGSATFNLNLSPGTVYNPPQQQPPLYNPISPNYKSFPNQPPSTSYGVPIAPPLNSYTYNNGYQNQFGGYPPSTGQGSNGYINPSQISITNDQRFPGQYAEPPPLNQVKLSNIDANYNSVQSSYDATPPRPPKRKPAKVNSKRVSTKPPPLNIDEEIIDDDRDQTEYNGESYSYFKTMPQPSLPNTYDQEEFHTVKNKRKQSKQSLEYYVRDETSTTSTTTKRPKKGIEVTLRIPDEDYLDDLVKVVQTTKRPKKKSKQTTSHILDTEDLRDAYDNNAAYYPTKTKKEKTRTRYTNQQTNDYDDYNNDDDGDDDYDNDRISHINSKESERTKSHDDTDNEPVEPRYWDKSSNIYKQYGIRARNDNIPVGSSYEVYSNNGFRPIRKEERSDIYIANPSIIRPTYVLPPNVHQKFPNIRISSTLRTVTTTEPSTLFVWDGKELPKNHKLA